MMTSNCNLTEVFDSNFKYLYMVPSDLVVHAPSPRLNIARLVICRNYVAGKPGSCVTGAHCKFVHVDVDFDMLEAFPIHVNYIWRHEDLCTYKRLPPGRQLNVLLPNEKHLSDEISSERILLTRAVLAPRKADATSLTHCAHYYFNHLCYRGESCNFVHAVFVDPNISRDFKRLFGCSNCRRPSDNAKTRAAKVIRIPEEPHSPEREKFPVEQSPLKPRGEVLYTMPEVVVPPSMTPTLSREESTPSAGSSEESRTSLAGEDGTLDSTATSLSCRGKGSVGESTTAHHDISRRRARFYRHDPYRLH